ncbi:hypothetical protein [Acinetobacter pittii]|uniref:hypothetical protein n=1 Tax=Acinetobacter pittii TaxID=48296 RepID=UPI00039E4279|nr:hypothetical protein [Acinetobacter pittii]
MENETSKSVAFLNHLHDEQLKATAFEFVPLFLNHLCDEQRYELYHSHIQTFLNHLGDEQLN